MNFKHLSLAILLILIVSVSLLSAQNDVDQIGGTVLLQGQVLDTDGTSLAGAVVEIWQTDINGNYDHPNDADPSVLLEDFQYFGTATADDEGYFAFLTLKPNAYGSRPPHLHIKVKLDDDETLITQFYFEEDREVFNLNSVDNSLFLTGEDTVDDDGNSLRVATGNLVIDLGENGTLAPTATQAEGPFYPVVDFSDYDNNLISVTEDDPTVLPLLNEATQFNLFNLNTATGEEFLTIPDVGNRMVREFEEYRPYISILQFRREIGKYVDEEQVAAYEAYVYVPIDVNESDAETLKQLPGVDETIAENLLAQRPFESNDNFLGVLAEYVLPEELGLATFYLDSE